MNQKSKYDPKGFSLGILISLGAAGIGFLLGHYGVPYLLYEDLSCNTLTDDDWKKSHYHSEFKSLASFIQSCTVAQNEIDLSVKVMPQILLTPVGFGIFFVYWVSNGWHLKKEEEQ